MKLNEILRDVSAKALSKCKFVECIQSHLDVEETEVYEVLGEGRRSDYIEIVDNVGDAYSYPANIFRKARQ